MMRLVLSVAALLALSPGAFADVYRYVDAQGNVQYTDKPALLPAQKLAVQSRATDNAALAAQTEADRARVTANDTARQQASAQQADQRAATQLTATAKAEQCAKARERDLSYSTSVRLYETLPDGQRRYLTDAELTAARTAAKSAVADMCK